MDTRMIGESLLNGIKKSLQPKSDQKQRIHDDILRRIRQSSPLISILRGYIDAPEGLKERLWQNVFLRLRPVKLTSPLYHVFQWSVVAAAFVLLVRIVPALINTESTTAKSLVLLLPTEGDVSISSTMRSWEDIREETELTERTLVRTRAGQATIILHDDGVIRLAPFTAVEIHDLSDRPMIAGDMPTVTLVHGTVWVQGLLSSHISPLTISTSYGDIAVHEGSISIEEGTAVVVSVWDRRATVLRDGIRLPLVAGERTWLWEENIPTVKKIALTDTQDSWNVQNLTRDSAHRRDVALWQHERRADVAGILPSSPLYSVKRAAEEVDVLLTFGKEARFKKKLHLADKRLNEAAAVLSYGGDAEPSFEAYTSVLLALSGDSTEGMLSQIIDNVLKENTATVSAVMPQDPGYRLKRAVLEAHSVVASQSDGKINASDVEGILLVDSLNALVSKMRKGENVFLSGEEIEKLFPYLAILEDSSSNIRSDVRKEARSLLEAFAIGVNDRDKISGDVSGDLLVLLDKYLPFVETVRAVALSDEDVQNIVSDIVNRVLNTFTMKRSRENQLFSELRALGGHPDQARILRRLYQAFLDQPWYAAYVRDEMKKLNERVL